MKKRRRFGIKRSIGLLKMRLIMWCRSLGITKARSMISVPEEISKPIMKFFPIS